MQRGRTNYVMKRGSGEGVRTELGNDSGGNEVETRIKENKKS